MKRLPTQEGAGDRPLGTLFGHFFALRVRPAGRTARQGLPQDGDGVLPDCWLLVQWPPGHDEPSGYWLSDLPVDTFLSDLVLLAKAAGASSMTTANSDRSSRSPPTAPAWSPTPEPDFWPISPTPQV